MATFFQTSAVMANSLFEVLGRQVLYFGLPASFDSGFDAGFDGGGGREIQAIIDKDIQPYPDAFDSALSEKRTEISFLKSDVSVFSRNDYVVDVDYGTIYTIEQNISDDDIVVKYAVTQQ